MRIKDVIEELREKMISVGMERGLTDENVVAISQKLDRYIVIYQKLKVGILKPKSKWLSRVG